MPIHTYVHTLYNNPPRTENRFSKQPVLHVQITSPQVYITSLDVYIPSIQGVVARIPSLTYVLNFYNNTNINTNFDRKMPIHTYVHTLYNNPPRTENRFSKQPVLHVQITSPQVYITSLDVYIPSIITQIYRKSLFAIMPSLKFAHTL